MDILAICQKLKILWQFEIFVNTGQYGAGNFKTLLLTVLIRCELNVMINKAVIRKCKFMDISAICQKLKKLWHFDF